MQYTLPPFETERNGAAWGYTLPLIETERNGGSVNPTRCPPRLFKTKRKDTGAASAAPVRKEKKRHGGNKCCPRSKSKEMGQRVLPRFEIKNEKRGKEEAMPPPSLAISPASSFPIPLPPRSISFPPRSSSLPPHRFWHLHPLRRGEAAVVTCRRLSSAVTWRVGVVNGGDVACGGRLGR